MSAPVDSSGVEDWQYNIFPSANRAFKAPLLTRQCQDFFKPAIETYSNLTSWDAKDTKPLANERFTPLTCSTQASYLPELTDNGGSLLQFFLIY